MDKETLILVVDDDNGIVVTISGMLEMSGYKVAVAYDGEEALLKIKENIPDLIILDLMLPRLSGWEVCSRLRKDNKTSHVPVIMLTARITPEDELHGLDVGADDYISKPFKLDILEARIKALLRRNRKENVKEIESGDIYINLNTHTVLIKDKPVNLRPKEFDVLYFLMSKKGKAVSRDMLSESVWGYKHFDTTRALDATIKRLREKMGSRSRMIETVAGTGYRFVGE